MNFRGRITTGGKWRCSAHQGNYIKQSNTSFDHQLRNLLLVITLQNAEFVPSNKPFTSNLVRCFLYLKSYTRFSLVKVAPAETLTLVTRSMTVQLTLIRSLIWKEKLNPKHQNKCHRHVASAWEQNCESFSLHFPFFLET